MSLTACVRRLMRGESGASAVESALVLPVFISLVVGTISTGQLAGAVSSMHYAVEEAARCSAVNKVLCPSPSATQTYAQTMYRGGAGTPVFTATHTTCGFSVRAENEFELNVALTVLKVPLTASACYPGRTS